MSKPTDAQVAAFLADINAAQEKHGLRIKAVVWNPDIAELVVTQGHLFPDDNNCVLVRATNEDYFSQKINPALVVSLPSTECSG